MFPQTYQTAIENQPLGGLGTHLTRYSEGPIVSEPHRIQTVSNGGRGDVGGALNPCHPPRPPPPVSGGRLRSITALVTEEITQVKHYNILYVYRYIVSFCFN